MENNTTTKSLEEEKITQKKRQYWREHNSRHTKRRKLKNAVADFYTKLQEKRGTVIEKSVLAGINIQIKNILNLPYCWTDKDWDRAMTALSDLEKKYLKRRYTNPPKDEAQLYEEIKNLLAESTLGLQPKINIVLNILQELVEQQYLQSAEKMQPSPTNALLLLTQNLKHNMPSWFHKELLNLLYTQYKGKDFNEFIKQIRTELQNKKVRENSKPLQ